MNLSKLKAALDEKPTPTVSYIYDSGYASPSYQCYSPAPSYASYTPSRSQCSTPSSTSVSINFVSSFNFFLWILNNFWHTVKKPIYRVDPALESTIHKMKINDWLISTPDMEMIMNVLRVPSTVRVELKLFVTCYCTQSFFVSSFILFFEIFQTRSRQQIQSKFYRMKRDGNFWLFHRWKTWKHRYLDFWWL